MSWTNEIWIAIFIAFLVGIVVGYFVVSTTSAGVKCQKTLEKELDMTKTQLQAQQQQLETHFETSATLLATLADDYKKLYTHLAQSSQTLLPESNSRLEFFKQVLPEQKDGELPPKDYTEGSSGILK